MKKLSISKKSDISSHRRCTITYEYLCKKCNSEFEVEQKITDEKIKICPYCSAQEEGDVVRLVSGGMGFQLKGNGWFKSGGY